MQRKIDTSIQVFKKSLKNGSKMMKEWNLKITFTTKLCRQRCQQPKKLGNGTDQSLFHPAKKTPWPSTWLISTWAARQPRRPSNAEAIIPSTQSHTKNALEQQRSCNQLQPMISWWPLFTSKPTTRWQRISGLPSWLLVPMTLDPKADSHIFSYRNMSMCPRRYSLILASPRQKRHHCTT